MWLISIPVWGQPYVNTFLNWSVPALKAALAGFPHPVKFLVHTDHPDRIGYALRTFHVELRPVSQAPRYTELQKAHAEAVAAAAIGDVVVLLNADLIVSRNLFHACARHFQSPAKAVVLSGIRTDPNGSAVPIGADSRYLLQWAWAHRHQIIRDLEWGNGVSKLPTNIFFSDGPDVVLRGFHLHPVAVHKIRELPFQSTIDGDLLDFFNRGEIHVVTSPDDMSMLEISEPTRRFPVNGPMDIETVIRAMRSRASSTHRWLFRHRIVVQGEGKELGDTAVADAIIARLPRR